MKKTGIVILSIVLPLCLMVLPMSGAMAEATSVADGVESNVTGEKQALFADYFENVWLDKIIEYACVLLGAVSATLIVAGKVKKAHATLVEDSKKMSESQKDLQRTQRELAVTKEAFLHEITALTTAIADMQATQKGIQGAYVDATERLDRLKQAVAIGFCNDKCLVQNGYAKEIARILGGEHEEE